LKPCAQESQRIAAGTRFREDLEQILEVNLSDSPERLTGFRGQDGRHSWSTPRKGEWKRAGLYLRWHTIARHSSPVLILATAEHPNPPIEEHEIGGVEFGPDDYEVETWEGQMTI
jgi:hypothetical protein